jgi:hypothetical protein
MYAIGGYPALSPGAGQPTFERLIHPLALAVLIDLWYISWQRKCTAGSTVLDTGGQNTVAGWYIQWMYHDT